MSVSDAVEEVFQQTINTVGTRASNPLWRLINHLTGYNPAFCTLERYSNTNCAALRLTLRTFVRQRTSGQKQSSSQNGTDLLTLMLEHPQVFSEEFIVDELIDFLAAGTQTS